MMTSDFYFDKGAVLPAFILALSLIAGAVFRFSKKINKKFPSLSLYILIAGAFLSSFILFFSPDNLKAEDIAVEFSNAFVSSIKLFGFNFDPLQMRDEIFGKSESIGSLTTIFLSFISVYIPMLTVKVAMNIFNDTATQIKYVLFIRGGAHIFSELNPKSICLARDIRQNDKHAKILFMNVVKTSSEEARKGLLREAKDIGAYTTRKSALDFHYKYRRNPSVYLIDLEETNNTKNGIWLYNKYLEKPCNIHVFSTLESAETFIDAIDKKDGAKAKINLVNLSHIIAYDLMTKYPMYEAADRCDSKTMSVLVIGADATGTECAKAAMWCGRMNNYGFRIRIIGPEEQKEKFSLKYGDIKTESEKAGAYVNYKFLVSDLNGTDFTDSLNRCIDSNYIIVSTGDDEKTISVATHVRKHIIKSKIANGTYSAEKEPVIIPIISNIDYYRVLQSIQKSSDVCDTFIPYGCYCDVCRMSTITNWPIEKTAEQIHGLYYKKDKNNYHGLKQTEKRSNRANAVHSIYKMKDAGIDLCKSTDNVYKEKLQKSGMVNLPAENLDKYLNSKAEGETKTRLEKLIELEHDRWSVFQLLDGWTSWETDDIIRTLDPDGKNEPVGQHKMPSAMLHGCIIPNDKLRNAGEKLYGNPDYFISHDKEVTSLIGKKIVDIINNQLKATEKENDTHILIYVPKEDCI